MTYLDLNTWNRKEHFHFFRQFDEPFFGITVNIDLTKAYQKCKKEGLSLYLYYLYQSIKAVNEIPEFRYRIVEDQVAVFDEVHLSAAVLREDKTFAFSFFLFKNTFEDFVKEATTEIARVQARSGLCLEKGGTRIDTVHYSALPWVNFTGVSHARNLKRPDSAPKISFGKIVAHNGQKQMSVSVHVNHALMDGYHVGLYYDRFRELLDQ